MASGSFAKQPTHFAVLVDDATSEHPGLRLATLLKKRL